MKVRFVVSCEIEVVENFDEESDQITEKKTETISQYEELDFDVIAEDETSVTVQFPDGSVAFNLQKEWFYEIESESEIDQKQIEQIWNGNAQAIRLVAGEMTPNEMRTTKAIISFLKRNLTKEVVVTVSGGVVQDVDAPKNTIVIIKDYDVDGCDESQLSKDDNDEFYQESIWSNP